MALPSPSSPHSLPPPASGIRHALACALAAALALTAPSCASADCIDDAAQAYAVNPYVLRAIGWHESRLDPAAQARNADGSVDRGAFQINSVHWPELARRGIAPRALDDGCASAAIAAWHYRRQVERYGNTWTAVGAYHSRTPARNAWYAQRIAAILVGWHVLPRAEASEPEPAVIPLPSR